jgi:hypothetical protein
VAVRLLRNRPILPELTSYTFSAAGSNGPQQRRYLASIVSEVQISIAQSTKAEKAVSIGLARDINKGVPFWSIVASRRALCHAMQLAMKGNRNQSNGARVLRVYMVVLNWVCTHHVPGSESSSITVRFDKLTSRTATAPVATTILSLPSPFRFPRHVSTSKATDVVEMAARRQPWFRNWFSRVLSSANDRDDTALPTDPPLTPTWWFDERQCKRRFLWASLTGKRLFKGVAPLATEKRRWSRTEALTGAYRDVTLSEYRDAHPELLKAHFAETGDGSSPSHESSSRIAFAADGTLSAPEAVSATTRAVSSTEIESHRPRMLEDFSACPARTETVSLR